MWVLVFVFGVCIFESRATNQCAVGKSENACVCRHFTRGSVILSEADCTGIDLEYFPTKDQLSNDLNRLDLSHNTITKLVDQGKYSSIFMQTLILSYNYISVIDENFFGGLPNLVVLDLSHNNITSLESEALFHSNKILQHLDLSFNKITALEANIFLPLSQLQVLDLSYNDVALGQQLSQRVNALTSELGLNPNVVVLKLDNLGLKNINNIFFNNYTLLTHLSLADNHFEDVPKVPYSVEYLDLSGSDISVLQAKHLSYHSLKTLKLERMSKLESIHHYAFYNLQALEELSVRNCHKLDEFNELLFGRLHKNMVLPLKTLILSGNGLKTLNSTYKYLLEKLDHVDLSDNPWNCDCDLLWLQEFENIENMNKVVCTSPNFLATKKLFDVEDYDVPTCYPEKYGKKSHRIIISVLILLVFVLISLIGYLIYYAPNWHGNRSIRLGPQSPYSPAMTEES